MRQAAVQIFVVAHQHNAGSAAASQTQTPSPSIVQYLLVLWYTVQSPYQTGANCCLWKWHENTNRNFGSQFRRNMVATGHQYTTGLMPLSPVS